MQTTTANIYHFPSHLLSSKDVKLSDVGGKALSLIKMAESGLPVPPGFVLPVQFFAEWLEQLKGTAAWGKLQAAKSDADLNVACAALKEEASKFKLTEQQKSIVIRAIQDTANTRPWFAVRSSSPEEDLEGSSFAGGYETILGVTPNGMEDAIRRAFASCLDYRVAVYKAQHGFDPQQPKIAVVVQSQIASDVAGVGFSLNPVTNFYDEAVFNANWGLGETVVAGLATPDTFVVGKIKSDIVQRSIGAKEVSIVLREDGGTEEQENPRRSEPSLTDDQILSLTHMIIKVEGLYGKPMDIEWAFSNGELLLLQARPITSHVPLPPEMVTAPGAPRRLYLDGTISVQGLYEPLSVMATDFLGTFIGNVTKKNLGRNILDNVEDSPIVVNNGRLYVNVSNAIELAGKDHLVKLLMNMDPLAAKALAVADAQTYKTQSKIIKQLPLHMLWHLPEFGLHLIESRLLPEHAHRSCQQAIENHMREIRLLARQSMPLKQLLDEMLERTGATVFGHTMPVFVASRIALEKMKGIVGEAIANSEDFNSLQKSLPHNPTVEMGLALYHVSQLLPTNVNPETFSKKLKDGTLPEEFSIAWREYMDRYGHRCPVELDIASPRYRDNPETLLEQLITMRQSATAEDNPQARFDRNQTERHEAYQRICEKIHDKGWLQLQRFSGLYRVFETLGGYRETHKYLLIMAMDFIRQRVLERAEQLVEAGRLDNVNQIFDLKITEVDEAMRDDNIDLRELGARNRAFIDRLKAVPRLPQVIDSRGLILRPPTPPVKEGEALGTPISSGIVRGPVKVLHSPDEKPLNKGDILVARATDPGWTPLFVNAAGVILEIGGMLQHGALVAREYGLPCVAGIQNATELWPDGTMVEVDGYAGIVRLVQD